MTAGRAYQLGRCAPGRLHDAYPAGEHDIEIRLPGGADMELLRRLSAAIETDSPRCRRIVYAAPEGDLADIAAAEAADFRYVVDVDVPGASLSLLVAEPGWVTQIGTVDVPTVPSAPRR
ncbi:MAG TPA: hypothetical protein VJT31_31115 [Rugosimonospora sp.]|nr:hypothetical protein [Rugosimonospora sp.]